MKGNPIIQIKNCYDSLHNKEKMIADVILKNPEKIPYISVVDLAKQAKTSCSSIVRFCKIMGYSGYSEFKTELAMYSYDLTGNLHYALNEEDSSASAATQHLLQLHSRELSAAAEQIDCGRLEEAPHAMSPASCVCIFGNLYSGLIAAAFQARLKSIGIPCFLSWDKRSDQQDVLTLSENSVFLAITMSGFSKDTVQLARAGKEKGSKVIALTTCSVSPVIESCDIPLVIPLSSRSLMESRLSADILFQDVLNLLFILLDDRQNPERRNQYENFFAELIRDAAMGLTDEMQAQSADSRKSF